MPFKRSSGLLLHISSLPSLGGIGDLGPAAYAFANFLHSAGQRIWQVLPLSPVGFGGSPYSAVSAMACNPLFVSLEVLRDWGWIGADRIAEAGSASAADSVAFDTVIATKLPLLREAATNFLAQREPEAWTRFESFCAANAAWLDDYAAFVALREQYDNVLWTGWPAALADREPAALAAFRETSAHAIAVEKVIQFAFAEQWQHLREYCRERGVQLMGDVAIFVSYDSADVWTNPDIFELDEQKIPIRVAGVPPDYFSATGQRWGNPLYRWDRIEKQGFAWWIERMQRAVQLYDMVRLDHFRGFEAYWAIPHEDDTAVRGRWVKAPGSALFHALRDALGELPFVAEDLGIITPEVEALRTEFDLPGMRVLQFGFGNRGAHTYLPHRFERNTVVYTGTHDNDSTMGWWQNGATVAERDAVCRYCGLGEDGAAWSLIRCASSSVADVCLFPVQDVIGLGSEGRMNIPSAAAGNWSWRLDQDSLSADIAAKLWSIADTTDRTVTAEIEILQAERIAAEEAKAFAAEQLRP